MSEVEAQKKFAKVLEKFEKDTGYRVSISGVLSEPIWTALNELISTAPPMAQSIMKSIGLSHNSVNIQVGWNLTPIIKPDAPLMDESSAGTHEDSA